MMKSIISSVFLAGLVLVLLSSCSTKQVVKEGDHVKVNYTGKLEDGTVFDSSQGREPLEFTVGSGDVIPGFDKGVIGMAVGDSKTVTISPEDAYGPKHDELMIKLGKAEFPPDLTLAVGQQLQMRNPNGGIITVTVTDLAKDSVTVDANHPLAGKTLIFDISLVEIG